MVWWGIVPGAVLVAIIITVVLVARGPLPTPNSGTATILRAGMLITVNESSFVAVPISLPFGEHLSGSFTAAPTVQAYVLTKSQFGNVTQNGQPVSSTWASGNTTSASVSLGLKGGLWYIEFDNPWTSSLSNVTITTAFQLKT
jgi:hypothetical protein